MQLNVLYDSVGVVNALSTSNNPLIVPDNPLLGSDNPLPVPGNSDTFLVSSYSKYNNFIIPFSFSLHLNNYQSRTSKKYNIYIINILIKHERLLYYTKSIRSV